MDKEEKQELCPDDISNLQEIEQEIEEVDPDALEDIPKAQKGRLLRAISMMVSSSHSGPLPRPEDLEKYNGIIPNGADRIMSMAEKQSQHRLEIEKSVIAANNRESGTGQWMGFILGVLCLSASVFLGLNGQPWLGGILGGSTIIGLATVFVLGKKAQHSNDENLED